MHRALGRFLLYQAMEENKEERGKREDKEGQGCVYLQCSVKRWLSSLLELGYSCICCSHFLVGSRGWKGSPLFAALCYAASVIHPEHITGLSRSCALDTCFYFKCLRKCLGVWLELTGSKVITL